jgi:DNA polymerase-4
VRKILHIDMDCFYAAIEVRDHPELKGKPVAVGGESRRGVLTTANYEAREFGCRSAMPGWKARELCPKLIIMPVRFDAYRAASAQVRKVFGRFTDLIEPLSLDEAYLDVSHWKSSSASLAWEIRAQIYEETGLTASAGMAGNKLLAKIASDWEKPNGQYEVAAEDVDAFMEDLPVGKLFGVGAKMREKLAAIDVQTCGELQRKSKLDLAERFGRWGAELYERCRGLDDREVKTSRVRKTVSKENTLGENLDSLPALERELKELEDSVARALREKHSERRIKGLVVKLKFADFTQTTAEQAHSMISREVFQSLLEEAWSRGEGKAVRLIGAGVRLVEPVETPQMDLGLES